MYVCVCAEKEDDQLIHGFCLVCKTNISGVKTKMLNEEYAGLTKDLSN